MNDRTPHRRTLVGYITQHDLDLHTLRLRAPAPEERTGTGFILFEGKYDPTAVRVDVVRDAFYHGALVQCTVVEGHIIDAAFE